ncbi:hypothetical protein NB037_13825 [Rathayibacter sp. ZW T2_19]|uniref:Uncharacterized protein n=1 Tax=Rathayibacter rubneri TaxID=2950106 RepID=A0A9X2IVC3_9MICO|nr:hypothetical protein [Rathayibacter rubneri]MCM6763499.1 hypothetical protein [Rathayibacter rubneri]
MHEHRWTRLSRHPTSEGILGYLLCPCGAREIELVPLAPPVLLASRSAPTRR